MNLLKKAQNGSKRYKKSSLISSTFLKQPYANDNLNMIQHLRVLSYPALLKNF
jgi:hypothetical protein